MKLNNKLARGLVVVAAVVLLILPSVMMAGIYTSIDLEAAIFAILITILTAKWLPKLKWPIGAVAAMVIAVPPYPYWVSFDAKGGWYFNAFYGFNLQTVPFFTFAWVFVLALALFAAIFWAIRGRRTTNDF